MNRATIQHHAKLKAEGYRVQPCGTDLHGWTLTHDDGCGNGPANLMIGSHGCVAPTQWEAVAEGLSRIDDDHRYDRAPVIQALTPDVLDTSGLNTDSITQAKIAHYWSLAAQVEEFVSYLNSGAHSAAYFAGELWQIDRARRALGMED